MPTPPTLEQVHAIAGPLFVPLKHPIEVPRSVTLKGRDLGLDDDLQALLVWPSVNGSATVYGRSAPTLSHLTRHRPRVVYATSGDRIDLSFSTAPDTPSLAWPLRSARASSD